MHTQQKSYGCDQCSNRFYKIEELDLHKKYHGQSLQYNCMKCGKQFSNKVEFSEHEQGHNEEKAYQCEKCAQYFSGNDELIKHIEVDHVTQLEEVNCNKCNKVYSSMDKLRRHDWRSHREIECNICGLNLSSREEISNHRKIEHQMYRKFKCRSFPNCIDEDECFFEHDDNPDDRKAERSYFCPQGLNCRNQACDYNQSKHVDVGNVMCRFQTKCNRSECIFKHTMQRSSFLGNCSSNFRRK